jgi:hypothetical protein
LAHAAVTRVQSGELPVGVGQSPIEIGREVVESAPE